MPSLEPVGLDFVDRADVVVATEVDVPASRSELWDVVVDNGTWPEWFEDCRRCEGRPPVWEATGDTRRINVGPLRIDEEAVAIDEHERWAISVTATNLLLARRMLEIVELVDTSRDGEVRTELRWTAAFDLLLVTRPIRGLVERRFVDAWGESLERLAELVVSMR